MKSPNIAMIALASLLALSACSPAPTPQDAPGQHAQIPPQPPAGCSAQASRDWSAVGSQYYVIEAETSGESCDSARATIRIETRTGEVLFTRDYQVADVPLAFSPHADRTGRRVELEAWIVNTAELESASWLPAWPLRAARPPFFQPAVTRGQYESARGAQGPLFCYPDGAESNACVALAGTRALLLGSLTPERE